MSIRGNKRWLLWICGAGAIAALVTAAVSWKDIVVHYHLEQLRRDPASLPSFLDASAGAAKKLAARAFAREPQGREVVVSLFVDWFAKARDDAPTVLTLSDTLHGMDLGEVDRAILALLERGNPGRSTFWSAVRGGPPPKTDGLISPSIKSK